MSNVSFKTLVVDQRLAHLTATIDLDNDAFLSMGAMTEDLAFLVTLQHLYVVAKLNWPSDTIDTLLYNVWKEHHGSKTTEQETNSDGGKLLLGSD